MPEPQQEPQDNYMTRLRTAVRNYLLWEALNATGGDCLATNQFRSATATGSPEFKNDTSVDRQIVITTATAAPNIGTYTITDWLDNHNVLVTPNWPVTPSTVSLYSVQSRLAAFLKKSFWFDPKAPLPNRLTASDMPYLACAVMGILPRNATAAQIQEIDMILYFECAAGDRDPTLIENMWCILDDRLHRGRNERFRVTEDVGFHRAFVGAPNFELQQDDEGQTQQSGLYWKLTFDLTLKISRQVNVLA